MRSFFGLLQIVWFDVLMGACGMVVYLLSTWWSVPLVLCPLSASLLPSTFRTEARRPQYIAEVRTGLIVAWALCLVLTAFASPKLAGIAILASAGAAGMSWFLETSEVANSYLL